MWTFLSFVAMSIGLLSLVPAMQLPAMFSVPEHTLGISHRALGQWCTALRLMCPTLLLSGVYTLYAQHGWALSSVLIPLAYAVYGLYLHRTVRIIAPKPAFAPVDIKKETKDMFKGLKRGFLNNRNGIF